MTITKAHEGQQYKPGDTITLTHADGSVLVGEASVGGLSVLTKTLGDHHIDTLERLGWRVADVKPKPELLPKEPGFYADRSESCVYTLRDDGQWEYEGELRNEDLMRRFAELPLTRLRPEAEVRREVLEAVAGFPNSCAVDDVCDALMKRWGLE